MVAVCPVLFSQPQPVQVEGKYESNIWAHSPGSVLREAFIGQLSPVSLPADNHRGHHLLYGFNSFLGSPL